ncbi:MATE family efflux transporter [Brevibacterium samyangense]|uniref:MATE family efflux transporter n=1 Tax=Brevibacterium samyangense TaxID=366888 RepID=UPI0031D1648D
MRTLDRDILRLAVPALGALAAEPLFLMADTAMVGHLGPDALGSMAIATTVMSTVLGMMVFLAYATTPRVARRLGAGDTPGAITAGFSGIWLALLTSAVLLVVGLPLLPTVVGWFGASEAVSAGARDYLTISWWALPFMLMVVAATGLLRGLQDTRTPLVVAVGGFGLNIVLNAVFIYGFDMGVAGSALGSAFANVAMCAVYLVTAGRAAARHRASLKPDWDGVWFSARKSGWLLLRSLGLRGAIITLVVLATAMGTASLAAIQVAQTLFNSLALVLDSLAIAGQALIGLELGRRDRGQVLRITRRLVQWGIGFGVLVGVLLAASSPVLWRLFTSDAAVGATVTGLVLVLALGLPVAGYVFTLDGILVGAEDQRYLGIAMFLAMLGSVALMLVLVPATGSAAVLWGCFSIGFMLLRAVGLWWRVRGERWIVRAEALG